jgi:hypothetical protein
MIGPGVESDIAIDSITLENNTNCDISPNNAEPSNSTIDCTFEKDQCGWYHDINSDFQWIRTKQSSSSNVAPNTDHTNLDGFYMLIRI